jgi:hypothetical protein
LEGWNVLFIVYLFKQNFEYTAFPPSVKGFVRVCVLRDLPMLTAIGSFLCQDRLPARTWSESVVHKGVENRLKSLYDGRSLHAKAVVQTAGLCAG